MSAPLTYRWSGEGMLPLIHCRKAADEQFVIGQTYRMIEQQDRSAVSHSHEFAWLNDAWQNLPENLAPLYPSAEHLRKRALIEAGYYDEEIIDVGTKAAALRVAAYARKRDDFAFISVRGIFVIVRTAKSQSRRAMDKRQFQESKTAIMEVIAAMIGVKPAELAQSEAA